MRVLVTALLLSMASPAMAQDPGPTFQDSTGLTWSVATLELGLALTAIGVAASHPRDAQTVSFLMIAATFLVSGVLAGVTQALDAPVEPPMVFHHSLIGAALVGGMMSFSVRVSGERSSEVANGFGIAGLIIGVGASATYSVLRMDRLARDPALVEEAHLMSWGPVLTAAILGAILSAAGLEDAAALIGAVAGLIFLGAAITAVEVAIAENPAPATTMPLVASF